MGKAKDIIVKPISRNDANKIIKSLHYSGKIVPNSQLHFGVFLDGKCGGAVQFGPSLDKRKIIGLVQDTGWNEFIELNRLAMADWLPKNGESRVLSVCFRILKKQYPHLKWVVSFADGCQCGHGTIYQASGFVLTGISPSTSLIRLPSGEVIHKMTLHSNPESPRPELGGRSYFTLTGGTFGLTKDMAATGGTFLEGYQLRYLYFLDPTARERLTVPVIPFSKISELGANMYLGEKVCVRSEPETRPTNQSEEGGSTPTLTLSAQPLDDA